MWRPVRTNRICTTVLYPRLSCLSSAILSRIRAGDHVTPDNKFINLIYHLES